MAAAAATAAGSGAEWLTSAVAEAAGRCALHNIACSCNCAVICSTLCMRAACALHPLWRFMQIRRATVAAQCSHSCSAMAAAVEGGEGRRHQRAAWNISEASAQSEGLRGVKRRRVMRGIGAGSARWAAGRMARRTRLFSHVRLPLPLCATLPAPPPSPPGCRAIRGGALGAKRWVPEQVAAPREQRLPHGHCPPTCARTSPPPQRGQRVTRRNPWPAHVYAMRETLPLHRHAYPNFTALDPLSR